MKFRMLPSSDQINTQPATHGSTETLLTDTDHLRIYYTLYLLRYRVNLRNIILHSSMYLVWLNFDLQILLLEPENLWE